MDQENQNDKMDKLDIDLHDAEKIEKILEEKKLVFKRFPQIFNKNYIKKYEKYRKLLYENFLKNKDIIYNNNNNTKNSFCSLTENKKPLEQQNYRNEKEGNKFLLLLQEKFLRMLKHNEKNNNSCKCLEKDFSNEEDRPNTTMKQTSNQIKLENNKNFEKNKIAKNNNKIIIVENEENKNITINNDNENNYNENTKENNNIIFSSSDNNSNIIYEKLEKINFKNKFIVDKKNLLKQVVKKKQMQMVNLNESLVNNLNFEIANINYVKPSVQSLLKEMKSDTRPKSHDILSFKNNTNSKNLIHNKNQSLQIFNNLNTFNFSNKRETNVKNKIYNRIIKIDNVGHIDNKIDEEINENTEKNLLINSKSNDNNITLFIKSKENSKKTLQEISLLNEIDRSNINTKTINNINVYKTTTDKIYKNVKNNEIDLQIKLKKSNSISHPNDSIFNNSNNLSSRKKEIFYTKKEMKEILEKKFKLAFDENSKREEINSVNFHSDISANRYGLFIKIQQKDFKDNFNRLKNHLEYNTIENRISVSRKNNKTFFNNFFRKNSKNNNPNLLFNNVINNNPNENTNSLKNNLNSLTNNNKDELTKNNKFFSSENLINLESKYYDEFSKQEDDENIIYQNEKLINHTLGKDFNGSNEKLKKDFYPISRMLKTNYSWRDKLDILKSPSSAFNFSKEGLKTFSSNDNAEYLNKFYNKKFNKDEIQNYNIRNNNNILTNLKDKIEILSCENEYYNNKINEKFPSQPKIQKQTCDIYKVHNKDHLYSNNNLIKSNKVNSYSIKLIKPKDEIASNNIISKKKKNEVHINKKLTLENENSKNYETNVFSVSKIYNENLDLENMNNNSISCNNSQIGNLNLKKSFISKNSNKNKPFTNESPIFSKNIDSILNKTINLNDFHEKIDSKHTLKMYLDSKDV